MGGLRRLSEDGQEIVNAGVDVGRCALEGRVAGLIGVAGGGGVWDAPVQPPRVVGEFGAHFAGLVAQGDQVVQPVPGQRLQACGPTR
jgi:hypothetical protein